MAEILARSISIVGTFLLLSGCALPTATLTNFKEEQSTRNFQVADMRPESDKTQHVLSYMITDCSYGIWRLADTKTNPPRMVLLRHDLEAALGDKLRDETLVVNEYKMYANIRGPHDLMIGVSGGTATVSESSHNQCTKDRVPEGWFDNTSENSGGAYITEIHATINGKNIAVHNVYEFPLARYQDGNLVFTALRKSNAELANEIAKTLAAH